MNVLAVNGSPRKKQNTATLLENVCAGAGANGAETEMVHLYDYRYKGCASCFGCKLIRGKSFGRCAQQDDLPRYWAEPPGLTFLSWDLPYNSGSSRNRVGGL